MKENNMKLLISVALLSLVPFSSTMADSNCGLDYTLNFRLAYSKGHFEVNNQTGYESYAKTHNNVSRIGGSVSLDCGQTTAKYTHHSAIDLFSEHYEDTIKIVNAYSIGNPTYGTLSVGKMSVPYKTTGKQGDPFWDTVAGTTFAANNFGFSSMTRGFSDNSVFYTSPKVGRLKASIGYTGANSGGDAHLGLEYNHQSDVLGIQYIDLGKQPAVANGSNYKQAIRLYYQKKINDWQFSSSYEQLDTSNAGKNKFLNISTQKSITELCRIAFAFGSVSNTGNLINGSPYSGGGKGLTLGVFYKWIEGGDLYFLKSHLNLEEEAYQNSVALGFNYHLNL